MKTISQDQADEVWWELQTFLDQELQRLPAKYSGPIVLCDLEGKTRKQAARQLGWREGTFSSRLSRGRALLAKRLSRHGLAVSGGVLAAILCRNVASACMPAGLLPSTIQAATLMAAGKALATGVISAKVVALTEGMLKTMLMAKLKVAVTVVMALNLVGAGAGLVYCQTSATGQTGKDQLVAVQTSYRTAVAQQQPKPKVDGKNDEKKDGAAAPQPLPESIVKAWKEAGAKVGWVRVNLGGITQWVEEEDGKAGDLPAFSFPDGFLENHQKKLLAPASPFGVSLTYRAEFGDAGLKELAELKNLQVLDLTYTGVTDAGMKDLAGLKNLQTLWLSGTGVADAGLRELAGLNSLQALYLDDTKVTDTGTKELAGLKNLQTLDLHGTSVADPGLKKLATLKKLRSLNVERTHLTDAGLKELAGLKGLQTLDLNGTPVTDEGLKELARLQGLQRLDLGGTPVTDAGLKELARLQRLQRLDLGGTRVTDAGLKELAQLQGLQILSLT